MRVDRVSDSNEGGDGRNKMTQKLREKWMKTGFFCLLFFLC